MQGFYIVHAGAQFSCHIGAASFLGTRLACTSCMADLLNELLERRGESINAWLDDRFRDIRSAAEAVQVDLNVWAE